MQRRVERLEPCARLLGQVLEQLPEVRALQEVLGLGATAQRQVASGTAFRVCTTGVLTVCQESPLIEHWLYAWGQSLFLNSPQSPVK